MPMGARVLGAVCEAGVTQPMIMGLLTPHDSENATPTGAIPSCGPAPTATRQDLAGCRELRRRTTD
jgi:hypothetical protein